MEINNKKYIPTLRFPEFQNDGEWALTPIGKYYKVQGGFAFKSSEFKKSGTPIIRISNIPNEGIYIDISNSVYYDRIENEDYFLISRGDLLIAMSGATTGKTAIYNQDRKAYLNQRVGLFKSINSHNYYPFICQWVKSNYFYAQLKRTLAAGAQPNISGKDIESFIWAYPNGNNSFAEQKKIADCFVSIDKEIDATKRKLELLKEHEKGLMQRLFPGKGKTTPELRFPEFQNDGEWALTPIGKYYKVQGGFAFKSSEFKKSGTPIIRISNIPNEGIYIDISNSVYYDRIENEDYFLISRGDLLIAMSGATTGKTAIYNQDRKAYLNQRVGLFKSINSHNYYPFICQWVKSNYFYAQLKRTLAAGAQPNISGKDIESFIWAYPNGNNSFAEQKKIADCLSSLDKYIDAAKRKLELLKEHEKGLMQQLFPKL